MLIADLQEAPMVWDAAARREPRQERNAIERLMSKRIDFNQCNPRRIQYGIKIQQHQLAYALVRLVKTHQDQGAAIASNRVKRATKLFSPLESQQVFDFLSASVDCHS